MQIQQTDLAGTHYNWVEEDKKMFTGQPTRRLFDRFNGNQVLFLINFYGSLSGKFNMEQALLIEQQIADRLPVDSQSEISVFNWIRSTVASRKVM